MTILKEDIARFVRQLRAECRSAGTIEKYLRDGRAFAGWLDGRPLTTETAALWREHLLDRGYASATINSMLAAVNALLGFLGCEECRLRLLRVQRRTFRAQDKELTRAEYQKLLDTANVLGQERLEIGRAHV